MNDEIKIGTAILNWNTGHITEDSVVRLKIDGIRNISIVDNGSKSVPKCYHSPQEDEKYLYSNHNLGFSIGKNLGIDLLDDCDFIFLLNGDIRYVPGTIDLYYKVLLNHPQAFCVGMFDFLNFGTMGVQDSCYAANNCYGRSYRLEIGYPVSWCHYGLYRADVFHKNGVMFPTQIPFDKPGHGYEDDWHYHEVLSNTTYKYSIAIDGPTYFHDQFISKKSLEQETEKYSSEERKIAFEQRWGQKNWFERHQAGELQLFQLEFKK